MNQRFRDAVLFRLRAARPIDVRAGPVVAPIEEQHAGPEVDGGFELAGKIMIETRHEELLNPRVVFGARVRLGGARA